jgi:beta-lactam-binding protein with PASTA domain
VVAAGWSITCTYQDFELTFYMPNGAPDPSVGSGGKRCIVPDVRRKKLAAARAAIARRDCTVGPIGREFSRTVKKGFVIGQFPRGGTECLAGQKVVLSVSKGKRPRR